MVIPAPETWNELRRLSHPELLRAIVATADPQPRRAADALGLSLEALAWLKITFTRGGTRVLK